MKFPPPPPPPRSVRQNAGSVSWGVGEVRELLTHRRAERLPTCERVGRGKKCRTAGTFVPPAVQERVWSAEERVWQRQSRVPGARVSAPAAVCDTVTNYMQGRKGKLLFFHPFTTKRFILRNAQLFGYWQESFVVRGMRNDGEMGGGLSLLGWKSRCVGVLFPPASNMQRISCVCWSAPKGQGCVGWGRKPQKCDLKRLCP